MNSKHTEEIRKHCTKERVPGEQLSRAEHGGRKRGGGGWGEKGLGGGDQGGSGCQNCLPCSASVIIRCCITAFSYLYVKSTLRRTVSTIAVFVY